MAKYRQGRINDAVREELAVALRDCRDPRIRDNFVSVTRAEVAADLKTARIYFSVMGDEKAAAEGLRKASGLLRHHLAESLNLRITPELLFTVDHSMEHGARISQILHEIEEDDRKRAEERASSEAENAAESEKNDG